MSKLEVENNELPTEQEINEWTRIYPIKEQNYIGKVIFTVPKIGLLSTWFR